MRNRNNQNGSSQTPYSGILYKLKVSLFANKLTNWYFSKHVIQALYYIKDKPVDKQIAFVKSWNEWGEGNYMEPDMEFGKGRIKALKDAIYEVKQEVEKE